LIVKVIHLTYVVCFMCTLFLFPDIYTCIQNPGGLEVLTSYQYYYKWYGNNTWELIEVSTS